MHRLLARQLKKHFGNKYKYGFVTEIDSERPKKGLNEKLFLKDRRSKK